MMFRGEGEGGVSSKAVHDILSKRKKENFFLHIDLTYYQDNKM